MAIKMPIVEPVEIAATSVWDKETDFTSWLLEHPAWLCKGLGFNVALERSEYPCGVNRVDLYGHDDAGGVVIVENQLTASDARHLGQLMRYFGSISEEMVTAVWVAPSFTDEDLDAIRRLNATTVPCKQFYAVALKVDGSGGQARPTFVTVQGPDNPLKAKTAREAVQHDERFAAFWQQFLDRVLAEHPGWTPYDSVRAYCTLAPCIQAFIATRSKTLYYQLGFSQPEGFKALLAKKDAFERELGEQVEWVGERAKPLVRASTPFDIDDREQWPAVIGWLIEQHPRWLRAIEAVGELQEADGSELGIDLSDSSDKIGSNQIPNERT